MEHIIFVKMAGWIFALGMLGIIISCIVTNMEAVVIIFYITTLLLLGTFIASLIVGIH